MRKTIGTHHNQQQRVDFLISSMVPREHMVRVQLYSLMAHIPPLSFVLFSEFCKLLHLAKTTDIMN